MNIKKFYLSLFLILSFVLIPFGCANNKTAFDMYYFNTEIHIETHDKALDNKTKELLEQLFSSLEDEFSISKENSFTFKFNNSLPNSTIPISERGIEIFQKSKECYLFSNGLFNPAVYPLVKLWQFAPDYPVLNFTPPTESEVQQTKSDYDYDFCNLNIDPTENTITTPSKKMMLDFGGILKGYACDKACEILVSAGHKKGYVTVGSSSLNLLSVDSLSIRHPRPTDEKSIILTVNTKNQQNLSVSTSGDYQKKYLYGGKTYCHLINPSNGCPTESNVLSATIIGIEGVLADAYTTTLCLLEHSDNGNSPLVEMINNIISSHPSAGIFVVYQDGQRNNIITNKEQGEDFTLHDSEYSVLKI